VHIATLTVRDVTILKAEVKYVREQQEANAKTIQMLLDEQWSLKERIKQVRAEAWR
jgi:hypothetical protein